MMAGDGERDATVVGASFCVLSSSSGGNCSVLRVVWSAGGELCEHVTLIDLGLSPKRTRALLGELGLALEQVGAVVFTHLDSDHCHNGWCGLPLLADAGHGAWPLGRATEVYIHRSHLGRATRMGLNAGRLLTFKEEFSPGGGPVFSPLLSFHDDLGAASFRVRLPGGDLGFATDLGRVEAGFVEHLRGVDVLAIESNYCPRMQVASNRPDFLKRRIMGGKGHLSNQETAQAIAAIEPRSHVVLLHLSRECNSPELVASLHHGADYAVTIAHPERPTRWVRVGRAAEVVTRSSPSAPATL